MRVPIRPHTCPIVLCFCMQGISAASLPIDAKERPNLEGLKGFRPHCRPDSIGPIALKSRSKSASKPPGHAVRGHLLCWLLGLAKTNLCQAY